MLLNLLRFADDVADVRQVGQLVSLSNQQIDFVAIETRHIIKSFNDFIPNRFRSHLVMMVVVVLQAVMDRFAFLFILTHRLHGIVHLEVLVKHVHVESVIAGIDSEQTRRVLVHDVVVRVGVIVLVGDQLRRELLAELHKV